MPMHIKIIALCAFIYIIGLRYAYTHSYIPIQFFDVKSASITKKKSDVFVW